VFATGTTAAFTITVATVTVTPNSAQSKVYGAVDPGLTFTNDAGLSPADFSGSLARATGENVGTYAINLGTLSAGSNYTTVLDATPVTFGITPATLAVNAVANSKVFGTLDPALSATLSGFQFSDDSTNSGITGSASCSRTAGETVLGSPYTITCAPGTLSAANYVFATGTTAAFTITVATVTVTPNSAQSKVYGAVDPGLTFTNDAGLSPADFSGSLARATGENVGTYAINLAPSARARTTRPSSTRPR